MGKIKRYRNRVERFLSSDRGQSFFNFAYSIGAAIVIWGALFKILDLPGGDLLLTVGMGTEVIMFILTAFDRPPREYRWEDVFPVLDSHRDADRPVMTGASGLAVTPAAPRQASGDVNDHVARIAEAADALAGVSATLMEQYKAAGSDSEEISRVSADYLEQMRSLTRNIAGLNAIYELQLKNAGSQLETIDRVNRGMNDVRDMYEHSSEMTRRYREEAEKMTEHMQQLNAIYEKMLTAMTANPLSAVSSDR